jgi:hypothetical protein
MAVYRVKIPPGGIKAGMSRISPQPDAPEPPFFVSRGWYQVYNPAGFPAEQVHLVAPERLPSSSVGAFSRSGRAVLAGASELPRAAGRALGIIGLVMTVTHGSPHFWESYYDTESAELEFIIGKALHFLRVLGPPPRKPPHMGGDPYEYFRGGQYDRVNWHDVLEAQLKNPAG